MAKVNFKTFHEASLFSKHLAMTIKSTSSVHRDGDIWWVDDPRAEQSDTSQVPSTSEAHNAQNQYVKDGYDIDGRNVDGFNRASFDKQGLHRDTKTEYDLSGFNINGYDVDGYDVDGYDKNEFNREGQPKYPF